MNERTFTVRAHGEDVRGVLWSPEGARRRALVLAGHGLGMHKRAPYPLALAGDLVVRGMCVAAIDAPEHGSRRRSDDMASIAEAWSEHWSTHGASRIATEHAALIDLASEWPEVDTARVGYWGLSLGTQYGIGVLASEPRIRAAVLGLFSLADPGRMMRRYSPRVGCPVFFILQHEDEIHPADRVQSLFDLLASGEKELHASPGKHTEVPVAVFEAGYDFLERRLSGQTD